VTNKKKENFRSIYSTEYVVIKNRYKEVIALFLVVDGVKTNNTNT
jgi:hypothetical protein